jgi:hypothetical protein
MNTLLIEIFTAAGVVAVIAGFIFWRRRTVTHRGLLNSLTIALLIISVYLVISRADDVEGQWAYRSWPTAEGVIVSSTIAGKMAFHPLITYEYHFEGIRYTGQTDLSAPAFGNKRKRYEVAAVDTSEYPPGRRVTIHYNPTDPSQSELSVGPTYGPLLQLSFGVTLYMAAIFIALSLFRPRTVFPE